MCLVSCQKKTIINRKRVRGLLDTWLKDRDNSARARERWKPVIETEVFIQSTSTICFPTLCYQRSANQEIWYSHGVPTHIHHSVHNDRCSQMHWFSVTLALSSHCWTVVAKTSETTDGPSPRCFLGRGQTREKKKKKKKKKPLTPFLNLGI